MNEREYSRNQKIRILNEIFEDDDKTLYDYQLEVVKDGHKFKITNKSRQIGMSTLFAAWELVCAVIDEETRLIVSPSQRQSNHFMSYTYQFLHHLQKRYPFKTVEETKSSIRFENGGEIFSLPNSPNTIRGFRAHSITFDEFAHFLNETDKEIMTALIPSISRAGELSLISTPFGTENLFAEIWMNEEKYPEYSRHCINWLDCKDLNREIIRKLEFTDPLTYRQEYNNEFLEEVDEAEFPFSLIKKCIDMELEYEELRKDRIYYGGMDIGRKKDLSAISIWEFKDGKYILRKKLTFQNMKYRDQEEQVTGLLNRYTFKSFLIDATGLGNEMAENLHEDFGDTVLPVVFDNENKEEMVRQLKENMFNGIVKFPNDPILINNIRAIKRMYTSGGFLRFDSDRNSEIGHADLFWSIALALYSEKGGTTDFFIG